jgi:hypothetical protein
MILGMLLAGTTSWAMSTDEPLTLLLALYVRDASGLHPYLESDIPALEPAVPPDISSSLPKGVASNQWEAWWHEILEGGGFWPEEINPHDFAKVRGDPQIHKLYYWPSRYAGPNFPGLDASPELQALVRRHHQAALAWGSARKHEWDALERTRQRAGLEWGIVKSVERSLGSTARPFRLDLRLLPVAGSYVLRLSMNRALLSLTMYRDRAAYGKWLTAVVEELA